MSGLPPELLSIALIDALAPVWLLVCWGGYAFVAGSRWAKPRSVMGAMDKRRRVWMRRLLDHEMRMVDIQIVQTLARSTTFFASTAILIIAGLLAVLGSSEKARAVLDELPLVVETSAVLWDLKVTLLTIVFVYAFFKFTWALRLFNYVAIVIGGMPAPSNDRDEDRAGRVADRAADLAWFFHPLLYYGAMIWVVVVLFRREFHSGSLGLLRELERVG
ncbi:MAG: DUF599 domain-containing protein [Geminicoccaceae bacterium]